MSQPKKILFLTGTRADFGKLKSLINAVESDPGFEASIFVTGMHMLPKYGGTWDEVKKCGYKNIYTYINQRKSDSMDVVLAKTIEGLGGYVQIVNPDVIVIHGDRAEALAGAIVGALNNILVAHVEGGEVSGTIDESIRHSVSKLSHIHFVASQEAKKRLIQMGENEKAIYLIGSPDLDLMLSASLTTIEEVKRRYEILFDRYGIFIYHPVTTSLHEMLKNTQEVLSAVVASKRNYVVIYPNNDPGSEIILEELAELKGNALIRQIPSMRFESFVVLLKNADFMIGNSSAGIMEAPLYAVPTINIGTRQNGRFAYPSIINVNENKADILGAMDKVEHISRVPTRHFGDGKSSEKFLQALKSKQLWEINVQKRFLEID